MLSREIIINPRDLFSVINRVLNKGFSDGDYFDIRGRIALFLGH